MNRILKIIAYFSLSYILSNLANDGCSDFIDKLTENIISILTTILAINIPTSMLVVSEILKIKKDYEEDIDPTLIFKELKHGLIMQIFVLCSLIVILCCCDYLINKDIIFNNNQIKIISGTFVISSLIYYMEVIYDLGVSLFEILSFNNKSQ